MGGNDRHTRKSKEEAGEPRGQEQRLRATATAREILPIAGSASLPKSGHSNEGICGTAAERSGIWPPGPPVWWKKSGKAPAAAGRCRCTQRDLRRPRPILRRFFLPALFRNLFQNRCRQRGQFILRRPGCFRRRRGLRSPTSLGAFSTTSATPHSGSAAAAGSASTLSCAASSTTTATVDASARPLPQARTLFHTFLRSFFHYRCCFRFSRRCLHDFRRREARLPHSPWQPLPLLPELLSGSVAAVSATSPPARTLLPHLPSQPLPLPPPLPVQPPLSPRLPPPGRARLPRSLSQPLPPLRLPRFRLNRRRNRFRGGAGHDFFFCQLCRSGHGLGYRRCRCRHLGRWAGRLRQTVLRLPPREVTVCCWGLLISATTVAINSGRMTGSRCAYPQASALSQIALIRRGTPPGS